MFFIGGIFFKVRGQKIILGSRKSAILGIIWIGINFSGAWTLPHSVWCQKSFTNFHIRLLWINGYNNNKNNKNIYVELTANPWCRKRVMGCHAMKYIPCTVVLLFYITMHNTECKILCLYLFCGRTSQNDVVSYE